MSMKNFGLIILCFLRAGNEVQNLLDGHAVVVGGLEATAVRQDGFRALHHGGVCGPQHVVCIDDHVDAPGRKFLFGKLVVGRGHGDDRRMRILFAETLAEFLDVLATLVLGVDHDAVGTGGHVGVAAFQGVVHGLASDQGFAAGNHHEVFSDLGVLARTDLGAETFDGVLRLDGVGSEERVLLESHLVLDDHRGDAESFERAHREAEVFHLSARVAVEDDRLGRDLEGVVQVVQAGREVHRLDVRLALAGGVGKGRGPHAVELADAAVDFDTRVFGDKARKAVVRFKDTNDRLRRNKAAERRKSRLRGRSEGVHFLLETGGGDSLGVRDLDDLAALGFHHLEDLVTDILVRAVEPVVTVDDVVGLVLLQVLDIAPFVLGNDLRYALDVFNHVLALFVIQIREALVGRNRLVRKESNHHVTVFGPLVDDIDEARVHDVTDHS